MNSNTGSFQLSVLTYNTHLFGDLVVFDFVPNIKYLDDDRKQQLKAFLCHQPRFSDIVGLQEVWSGAFANNFKHMNDDHSYPNFFARDAHHGEFNRSGLCLLSAPGIPMSSPGHLNYIKDCNRDGWDLQDYPAGKGVPISKSITDKGCLFTLCTIGSAFNSAIPNGVGVQVGVFDTHFPTNASEHPESIEASFCALRDAVNQFVRQHPSAGVIVMGDFNIAWSPGVSAPGWEKYQKYICDLLLAPEANDGAGLTDIFAAVHGSIEGYTINGDTNLLMRHFEGKEAEGKRKRPDYIFIRNSVVPDAVTISPVSVTVLDNDPGLRVASRGNMDVSDHYPIHAVLQITFATAAVTAA